MIQTFFFRFVSSIFLVMTVAFWLILTAEHLYLDQYKGVFFILTAIIHVTIGGLCGYLIKRLHEGTFRDGLTGVGNRRYFYEKLSQEIKRSQSTHAPVSLVFIDIDNFKTVNDTFGHVQGDKVLVQMAVIFKEHIRGSDSLARWGGEEFAIILPDTDSEVATIIAERLRGVIASFDFGCKVTISAGITGETGIIDIDKFVSMADGALYRAKVRKNFVVKYSS